jgi:GT2 family glycosyltransferase
MQSSALMLIVHYGEVGITLRLLESLTKLSKCDQLEVWIVNNDDRDSSESFLQSMPNVMCIRPQANRGYFGGAKAGLDYYRQLRGGLPPWIVVANNDIIISDQAFLEKLFAHNLRNVGILAPRILSTRTKSDQNPFLRQRPGRRRVGELRLWLRNYHLARLHEQLSYVKRTLSGWLRPPERNNSNGGRSAQECIYAPHGSFLILSRSFFDRGGYIDDTKFLYTEEIILAELCRRNGLTVIYEPELAVIHDEHRATGRKYSRTTYNYQKSALEYITTQYLSDVS